VPSLQEDDVAPHQLVQRAAVPTVWGSDAGPSPARSEGDADPVPVAL